MCNWMEPDRLRIKESMKTPPNLTFQEPEQLALCLVAGINFFRQGEDVLIKKERGNNYKGWGRRKGENALMEVKLQSSEMLQMKLWWGKT